MAVQALCATLAESDFFFSHKGVFLASIFLPRFSKRPLPCPNTSEKTDNLVNPVWNVDHFQMSPFWFKMHGNRQNTE